MKFKVGDLVTVTKTLNPHKFYPFKIGYVFTIGGVEGDSESSWVFEGDNRSYYTYVGYLRLATPLDKLL